jgi:hypothetical protein
VGVIFIPIKSKSSTFAERWNGTSWSIQHTPNPARGPGSINELDGVSCSSGIVCTAVGAYGTSKALTLAERWHGG